MERDRSYSTPYPTPTVYHLREPHGRDNRRWHFTTQMIADLVSTIEATKKDEEHVQEKAQAKHWQVANEGRHRCVRMTV